MGNDWVRSIIHARLQLNDLFDDNPSLKVQSKDELQKAWNKAINHLISWFKKPENIPLAKKIFGKIPSQNDFPKNCPYSYQQIFDYKPWIKELDK
jgi:hypothetical protein